MISKSKLWEIQKNILPDSSFQCGRLSMVEQLIEECGEDDTLTVSKLRPMSDTLGDDQDVLIKIKTRYGFTRGFNDGGIWYLLDSGKIDASDAEGWIPMPVYKP